MLYADDATLFVVYDEPLIAARLLTDGLESVSQWATDWFVKFNPAKSSL